MTVDISKAKVTLTGASFTYNGKAKKPVKSVALGKKALKAGTDYDVAYSGNVNAGTAKAKATGKGAYAGSKSVAFKIKPAANKLVVKAAAKKVKAGTRPGTYKLMVKVTAAKTKNTKAAVSRTVTVTVKVEAGGKATKAQSANTQAARPLTAAAF